MTIILAIDPGPDMGFAMWTGSGVKTWQLSLGDKDKPRKALWSHLFSGIATFPTMVLEKFEFRKDDQQRDKIDYTPAKYEGICALFAEVTGITLVEQSPSQAEGGFWGKGNEWKLKKVGLYTPGRELRHQMSAARHLLYYMTFTLKDNRWLDKLK